MTNPLDLVLDLIDISEALERALGDAWPSVRDELAELLFRLDAKPIPMPVVRAVDVLLDRLLDGPAAALTRQVLGKESGDASRGVLHKAALDSVASEAPSGHLIVPIFFATNRQRGDGDAECWYSGERGALEYGIVEASVPARHQLGELEGPQWWKLEIRSDPAKHIVLLGVARMDETTFLGALRTSLGASGEPEVLVFIHGYNVTFDAAARRAAQLVRDLKFRGQAALYSWPSMGEARLYPADEATIEASAPHFERFLRLLLTASGARSAHIVAHSMGNRALVRALERLDRTCLPAGAASLGEVIFAAPDVDRDVFKNGTTAFKGCAQRLTLYASCNDLALKASKLLHRFPRAGDAGDALLVQDGLDTVDASAADTSLFGLGHSYFSDQRTILNDLHGMILNRLPPDRRFDLEPATSPAGAYWSYRE